MSISWPLERARDRQAREAMSSWGVVQLVACEYGILCAASIGLALAASCSSVLAAYLASLREGFCSSHWYHSRRVCAEWVDWPPFVAWLVYVFLSLMFASVPALLVRLAPGAKMSGIPELRSYFQGFDARTLLDAPALVAKLVGITLVGASGLFLGQEAPLVHIASIGTALMLRRLPISEARQRDLVLAATAAGLAVAFSAPLGGVMFAIEAFTPSKSVTWMCFVCAMLATITLRAIVAPSSALGGLVLPETGLFRVHFDRVWQAVEILPFTALGVLGGLYGALVPKLANAVIPYVERRPLSAVALLAVTTSLLCFLSPISRLPATDLVSALFEECRPSSMDTLFCRTANWGGLLYTLALAALLAPLAFTLPVPSGILFPAIVIGSLGGRVMGLLMQHVLESLPVLATSFCPDATQHCITPGVYAVVGAACFITGITRLTISSVVLMMEITGALTFVVPVMIGAIVAKWVNDLCGDTCTIYSSWQSSDRVLAFPPLEDAVPDLVAADIMTPLDSCTVLRGPPQEHLQLQDCAFVSVPRLGPQNEFVDLITARTGQTEPCVVLSPRASLTLVLSAIAKVGVRVVVLCKRDRFVGLLTRSDLVETLQTTHPLPVVTEYEIDSD